MPRKKQVKRRSPMADNKGDEPNTKKVAIDLHSKSGSDSSSESDIENYLQPVTEIDLNSSFFQTKIPEKNLYQIKKDNSGTRHLSESESENESSKEIGIIQEKPAIEKESVFKEQVACFEHIQAYNNKIEEARKHIEIYKAKRNAKENNINISDILAAGETTSLSDDISSAMYFNELETCSESEKEEWEEINSADEGILIPKKGVQITVELPGNARKKKGTDLMDIVKRRINRIKKENQVYIHKVHLLCWIAHGNYTNKVLCNENLIGLSLSLLPSQKSFPPQRLDIPYLEEMLQWYRKTISIIQPMVDSEGRLEEILEKQILHKKTSDYKNFVYIFICLLRSLGIRCRLMLSLQVEPLRPTTTELCSLSKVDPSSSKGNETVNKIAHEAKNTPKNSAKKLNTSKVISTKKVSHIKIKGNKLKELKTKKLDFEDLCLLESVNEKRSSTNASIKSSLNKINENSKPNKSNKEHANSQEGKKCEKGLRKGYNKTNTEESTANDLAMMNKQSKVIKQQTKEVSKSCENKSTSGRTKKTNDKRSTQKNKQFEIREEVKDPCNKGSSKNQNNSCSIGDKYAERERKEVPRSRKNDKNPQKTYRLEIPLRRSQRLSKSPENINEASVSPKNSDVTKSSESNRLDSKTKVNLNAFRIKMPFKLNSGSSKNNCIKTTNTIENDIPQLDGGNDDTDTALKTTKNRPKPSLKQLKTNSSNKCLVKQHPQRLRNAVQYKEIDSDEDFRNTDVSPNKTGLLKKSPEKKSGKPNRNIG
ncbi:hypothetical protein AMK59_5601, partial [Oryctes borbonicus]